MYTLDLAGASESTKVTAENLISEYLDASKPSQRFNVFIRTLSWAVTATVNADAMRRARDNAMSRGKAL